MADDKIDIIPFEPPLKEYFKTLNHEWLNTYFYITEEDNKILSDPEKIIRDGGCVLFSRLDNEIVGTCALIKESNTEYEVAKMAVTKKAQGKNVGSEMMKAILYEAKNRNAKLVSLDTANRLTAAIHLYKKFGFKQTGEERIHPLFGRKTFRMELKLD
jgi:putative acetyltransferase